MCLNKSWHVRTGWKGTSQDQLRGGEEKAGQVRKGQDKSEKVMTGQDKTNFGHKGLFWF